MLIFSLEQIRLVSFIKTKFPKKKIWYIPEEVFQSKCICRIQHGLQESLINVVSILKAGKLKTKIKNFN